MTLEDRVAVLEKQVIRLTIAMAGIGGSVQVAGEEVEKALAGQSDDKWLTFAKERGDAH